MTTKIKANNRVRKAVKSTTIKIKHIPALPKAEQGIPLDLPVANIDFSPLNYRTYYNPQNLEKFAGNLKAHGVIHPVTVRIVVAGRYELAIGERRLRGSRLAGLKTIPAWVRQLTDEEVVEMQLAENHQREDPHPMQEAQGIGKMQKIRRSIDEIAARLGKSKVYVYGRIKLLSLISDIQEPFLADCFTLAEAIEIATLSPESQQEFYATYCNGWKPNTRPKYNNLKAILAQFKCDLKRAPFDTKDKTLLPDVGACTKCPFNSATLKTLFPDDAKQSHCTKRDCFERKCSAHLARSIATAIDDHKPTALVFDGLPSDELKATLATVPATEAFTSYERNDITRIEEPEKPDKKDYTYEGDEDGDEDNVTEVFDDIAYQEAEEEYNQAKIEYDRLLSEGKAIRGLLVTETESRPIYFLPEPPRRTTTVPKVTAKEVQAALKAGTATPEMLAAEINRIEAGEVRSRELDEDKIQKQIHKQLLQQTEDNDTTCTLTDADKAAARWLIFQSLTWSERSKINHELSFDTDGIEGHEIVFQQFQNLSDSQFSHLIRTVMLGRSDSKMPKDTAGYLLRRIAKGAGINLHYIEARQKTIAEERQENKQIKISNYRRKIKRMQSVEQPSQPETPPDTQA